MIKFNSREPPELYMNGDRCVKAYMGGIEVWHRKCKVTFLNIDGSVNSVQYVEKGADAVAPSPSGASLDFYEVSSVSWEDCTNIQRDTVINPVFDLSKAYLFKSGLGVNSDYLSGFGGSLTIYDGDASSNYGSVSKLSVDTASISGEVIGSTNDSYSNYRIAKYARSAAALDVAGLRAQGFSSIKFSGSYNLPTVYLYNTTNLRDAFFGITTGTKITAKTTGVSADNMSKIEKYYSKSVGSTLTRAAAITNSSWSGSIDLPSSGSYYVVMGVLTKYVRTDANSSGATGGITINNIWLE